MTKISEEYALNSINIKPFFRIPVVSVGDDFLTNDGSNSVTKVSDKKIIHSWTLTHPHSFTCPVVYQEKNDTVCCVMNSNILLMWSSEDKSLKKASKYKFKDTLFAVLPIYDNKLLVLSVSGKVFILDTLASSSDTIGENFLNNQEDLVWADAIPSDSDVDVIFLSRDKENKTHTFHFFTLSENNISGYYKKSLVNGTDVLQSWCLNKSSFCFLSLWSNGTITSYHFKIQLNSTLLYDTSAGEQRNLLAADIIDTSHIALLKYSPKLKECSLEIWDIKYTTLKAVKVLKSVSTTSVQLSVINSTIFLSHNGNLLEMSIHIEKSTLAAAMGRSAITPVPNMQEFSWSKGKLIKVKSVEQNAEKMDTSEREHDPLSTTELIAQRLIKEGSSYLKYIPEAELVQLLHLAIRYKFKGKDKPTKIEPDVILNTIFSASCSDIFLVKLMKKLSLDEAIVTLETLIALLNRNENSAKVNIKPSDLQIFNWICLVIQSHMEALLLSKNKKTVKLLRKLDKCLLEKMQEYEDYESIQHLFLVIQKKRNILPEKYVDGKYSVETLDL